KCERLAQAAEHYRPMGENFKKRLQFFKENSVGLRNRLYHNWPVTEGTDAMCLLSIARIRAPTARLRPRGLKPETITLDDFMRHCLWLSAFIDDLHEAQRQVFLGGALEIADPKSDLPKAQNHGSPRKEKPAKTGKRGRKSPRIAE